MQSDERPSAAQLKAVLDIWSAEGEQTRLPVEGICMMPLIREGDRVHVVHGARAPRFGDIVLFRQEEALRVQRVVRLDRGSDQCDLKGDSAPTVGSTLRSSDLLGVVVAIERAGNVVRLDRGPWRVVNAVVAWSSYRESQLMQGQGFACRALRRVGRWAPFQALRPARLAARFAPEGEPPREGSGG